MHKLARRARLPHLPLPDGPLASKHFRESERRFYILRFHGHIVRELSRSATHVYTAKAGRFVHVSKKQAIRRSHRKTTTRMHGMLCVGEEIGLRSPHRPGTTAVGNHRQTVPCSHADLGCVLRLSNQGHACDSSARGLSPNLRLLTPAGSNQRTHAHHSELQGCRSRGATANHREQQACRK